MKKTKNPFWALFISAILNVVMGVVELVFGLISGSSSLLADSLDFFSDGVNYFSSIFILKKTQKTHDTFGTIKGYYMLIAGVVILLWSLYRFSQGWVPEGSAMTTIGVFALVVNLISTALLMGFRSDSLDLRVVWLCTRNDAINNIFIIIAGYFTLLSQSAIPDIVVTLFMSILLIRSGLYIIRFKKEYHGHSHTH